MAYRLWNRHLLADRTIVRQVTEKGKNNCHILFVGLSPALNFYRGATLADLTFADQTFADETFADQTFADRHLRTDFCGPTIADQTFADQTYADPTGIKKYIFLVLKLVSLFNLKR
jgi:hypothetical protein